MNLKRTFVCYLLVLSCLTISFGATAQSDDEIRIGVIYSTSQAKSFRAGRRDSVKSCRVGIEANGGVVVELFQDEYTSGLLTQKLEQLHGVLLPGGIDVDPRFYREANSPKLERFDTNFDQMEFAVLDYAKEHRLAVLGICRGHQVLNVFYGGSLVQDIPTEFETDNPVVHRRGGRHQITIKKRSLMHKLTGETEMEVNSAHHQSVKRLAPKFKVTAWAKDGTVEAMEYKKRRQFVLGVQFHPESMRAKDERCNQLFVHLLKEAGKVKKRMKQPVLEPVGY